VEHAVTGDARIVDENVDGAELGFDRADARLAGSRIGDVELEDRDAGLSFELFGGFVVAAVIGSNFVARLFQGRRNRGTDAAGAAGDQCNARHAVSFPGPFPCGSLEDPFVVRRLGSNRLTT
jgi:hypothetical protein